MTNLINKAIAGLMTIPVILSLASDVSARTYGGGGERANDRGESAAELFVAKRKKIGPQILAALRARGGVAKWDQDDCQWQNDNLAHCNETICVPPTVEGDDVLCGEVEVCFDHYGNEVPCS